MLNQKLTGQQAPDKTYIEDVFSTYLYTGNGSSQTITNGIDLAGKGGLVWYKDRGQTTNHLLADTTGGIGDTLSSNNTGQKIPTGHITSFNSNGYTLNSFTGGNGSGVNYASWTFRKAPKFFDVVTYTGDGVAGRTINHSLGQAPGMIIVKKTNSTGGWATYHRGVGATKALELQITAAAFDAPSYWNNTSPTSTVFTVGSDTYVNGSGNTYVAYLFAHDTTTDGLIQCGSFTADASGNANVELGWEPQYILWKNVNTAQNWFVTDTMRGWSQNGYSFLSPNTTGTEASASVAYYVPTATGFKFQNGGLTAGNTYIYMAIRRGPMRTPTDGTKVFSSVAQAGQAFVTTTFPVDLTINGSRNNAAEKYAFSRLTGSGRYLFTNAAAAEDGSTTAFNDFAYNTGIKDNFWGSSTNAIYWNFKRAPGFFDVVCYTGTGATRTVNHNLGVVPELMIVKNRSGGWRWMVYSQTTGNNAYLYLDLTSSVFNGADNTWNQTSPTSTVFTVGSDPSVNWANNSLIAYLFASCPGVSKVGSYTGNGTSQTINCGFTNGARFVLIKQTSGAGGDWFVWDTARGIVDAIDPFLRLNTTQAENTSNDFIDPHTSGFVVASSSAAINGSGETYIYLAIA